MPVQQLAVAEGRPGIGWLVAVAVLDIAAEPTPGIVVRPFVGAAAADSGEIGVPVVVVVVEVGH